VAEAAVARETLFALRETIARLEGKPVPALAAATREAVAVDEDLPKSSGRRESLSLETGIAALDEALDGGVPLDALTEIRSLSLRDAGASTGFALALTARLRAGENSSPTNRAAVLWIGDTVATMEAGLPYAIGLKDFGLEPKGFLHAAPRKLEEALWVAEAALASAVFSVVILEVRGNPARFGLTESRRLSLRAKAAGRPLFLLRQGAEEEASSALFRFSVEPAPASARFLPDGSMLGGSIGNPSFRLTLEKSRNPAPLSFVLEWNSNDRRFSSILDQQRPALSDRKPAYPGPRLSETSDRSDRPQTMGSVLAFDRAS
jgi:protein ImuA